MSEVIEYVKYKGHDIPVLDVTGPCVYRIETPSRGVFVEFHRNQKSDYVPRFKWSGLRTDKENWSCPYLDQAVQMLLRVNVYAPNAYLLKMTR